LAAARLARELLAHDAVERITVIAVIHPFVSTAFGDPASVAPLPQSVIDEMTHADETAARDAVHRTIAELGDLASKANGKTCVGSTAQELVRAARTEESTLIVMGSRGWGEARAVLLGSVSERVLHSAPCAVLIARPTAASEAR
jgi:nucleotide-binding universal stress UspA family protein